MNFKCRRQRATYTHQNCVLFSLLVCDRTLPVVMSVRLLLLSVLTLGDGASAVRAQEAARYPTVEQPRTSSTENSMAVDRHRTAGNVLIGTCCSPDFRRPTQPCPVESCLVERPLKRYKTQPLQSVGVSTSWLSPMGEGDLGMQHYSVSLGTGIPLGSFSNVLAVTPSVRIDVLKNHERFGVPAQLYDVGADLFYRRPLNERVSGMVVLRPSVRSDMTTSQQAFRLFGLVLLTWQAVPQRLGLSGGVVYLDRDDLPVLPAIGLKWTPHRRALLDLRFPESKIAWRLQRTGNESETWAYASAGLGGNTWAVTRTNGSADEFTVRDIRLLLGIEHLQDGGGGWYAEVGSAVGRRIEFGNTAMETDMGPAVVLEAGWRY